MICSRWKITRSITTLAALGLAAGACQSTGGVAAPTGPGHYRGLGQPVTAGPERVAYLPLSERNVLIQQLELSVRTGVSLDRAPYQPLIDQMNAFLAGTDGLKRISPESLPFGQDLRASSWTGPRATFGMSCDNKLQSPGSAARNLRDGEVQWTFGGARRRAPSDPRVFRTWQADADWRDQLRRAAEAADVDYVLLFTLGQSHYVTRGPAVGARHIEMGTGYMVSLPFHVRRDQCFGVLHIVAVLVDRSGNVVRSGAEGVMAGSVLGGAAGSAIDVIPEISVERIREHATHELREDLEGQPPAWRVAMEHLMLRLARIDASGGG